MFVLLNIDGVEIKSESVMHNFVALVYSMYTAKSWKEEKQKKKKNLP